MGRYKQSLAQTAVAEYVKIAESIGITPAQLALAWCYKQPHVASTIIGATSLPQLKENLDAWSCIDKITPEVEEAIAGVYKLYKDPSKTS
jgi:aryl-alcohol dehydrogenase-like predicted oxidoreductase